ncbi:hypothetical protein [Pseudomonas grimontii]|uniref:hypothetical protein n=1 Tax=Pseudomonas grimontii TaxID=129847 RepID=UPI00387B5178
MSSCTLSVTQMLDIADAHYAGGETRMVEVLPVGTRGDLLADFIASEINEVSMGADCPQQVVIAALSKAALQLHDVINALCKAAPESTQ